MYSLVLNTPSRDNVSNVIVDRYEIKTKVGIELLLAFFFLFLTVCILIATGVKIFTYYAKRRKREEELHAQ